MRLFVGSVFAAATMAASAAAELLLSSGDAELKTPEYRGVSLLADAKYGTPGLFRPPVFRAAEGALPLGAPQIERADGALVQGFPWGTIRINPDRRNAPDSRATWTVELSPVEIRHG